jgi:glucose/arabinose dehydrogenase
MHISYTRYLLVLLPLLLVGSGLFAARPQPTLVDPPTALSLTPVTGLTNLDRPTAFAFTPDGRMLITTQPGLLLIYADGALLPTPALDLRERICSNSERGLLGIAVDPDFATTQAIFVYYTARIADTCGGVRPLTDAVNRVARFTLVDDRATDEIVLIDNIPSPGGNHNAGDLQIGNDGYLYISVGDGGTRYDDAQRSGGSNDVARERFHLLGKVLRITRSGDIPPDNPFLGDGTARCYDPAPGGNRSGFNADGAICQETFAWGLRNPYRLAFDPNSTATRFLINDVGQGRSEEISWGRAGADYGWHCLEGTLVNASTGLCANIPPTAAEAPLFAYQRSPAPPEQSDIFSGCRSITAGAFVPQGIWPAPYAEGYLFADYICGRVFFLDLGSDPPTATHFLDVRTVTHLAFGPAEAGMALYIADYRGTIFQVRSNVPMPSERIFVPLVQADSR